MIFTSPPPLFREGEDTGGVTDLLHMITNQTYLRRCFLILFLFSFCTLYSQETSRWGAAAKPYPSLPVNHKGPITFDIDDPASLPVDAFIFIYRHGISEHDGDNCPFHPSCSSFLLDAVKSEGLITGGLMFWDRFTRDVNIYNRKDKYTIHSSGRFYDPPFYYSSSRNIYNYESFPDE